MILQFYIKTLHGEENQRFKAGGAIKGQGGIKGHATLYTPVKTVYRRGYSKGIGLARRTKKASSLEFGPLMTF